MVSSDTGSGGRGASEDSTVSVHECEVRMKVGEKHLEWFKVDQGVRQGCTLSPWLFNVCKYFEVVQAHTVLSSLFFPC